MLIKCTIPDKNTGTAISVEHHSEGVGDLVTIEIVRDEDEECGFYVTLPHAEAVQLRQVLEQATRAIEPSDG